MALHGEQLFRLITRLSTVLILCASAGCAAAIERLNGFEPRLSEVFVPLHGHSLTIHLSATGDRSGPLLVYVTGDGGWFGSDKEVFNKLVPWGHPVAAFSAREYIHHLGPHVNSVSPATVAEDYAAVIDVATRAIGLPASAPVILIGKSRGAGLEVAASLSSRIQARLQGLIAIGLTAEEEYVDASPEPSGRQTPSGMLRLYDVLPSIPLRVVVIQSTGDNYVPAGHARVLMGPDTAARRLVEIEADDHNFGGARTEMYAALRRTVAWLSGQ